MENIENEENEVLDEKENDLTIEPIIEPENQKEDESEDEPLPVIEADDDGNEDEPAPITSREERRAQARLNNKK